MGYFRGTPLEDNLRAHIGFSQHAGQELTLHHGLNGTEAKAPMETTSTFSHCPTSQGSPALISTPLVGCDLTWRRRPPPPLANAGGLESPPMTLLALPPPCWAGICPLFPAGKALGRQVRLPQHLRPTRGRRWAGCPFPQAAPTRHTRTAPHCWLWATL